MTPEKQRLYCWRHVSYDTDGDGECGAYATATEPMRRIMLDCVFDPKDLHNVGPKQEEE